SALRLQRWRDATLRSALHVERRATQRLRSALHVQRRAKRLLRSRAVARPEMFLLEKKLSVLCVSVVKRMPLGRRLEACDRRDENAPAAVLHGNEAEMKKGAV
ncbi:MAG TPA: hypothetical protein VF381_09075, partial [Thermoanaerobaculia bacterium]